MRYNEGLTIAKNETFFEKKMISIKDLEKYYGNWYGDDYEKIDNNGSEVPSGSKMILKYEEDIKKNIIHLVSISNPPASRIAEVETTWDLKNSVGVFSFDNDGWGNSGEGRIYFKDSVICINITITRNSYNNWGIFEGEIIFSREIK